MTEYGLGPDKWATAWLLQRYIDPSATLVVVEPGDALPSGVAFDIPGSQFIRQGDQAAFEVAMKAHDITDPDLKQIARIVHDIEVNFWGAGRTIEAPFVERGFRSLQKTYGRDQVPPECYLAFFDELHARVRDQRRMNDGVDWRDWNITCDQAPTREIARDNLVEEVPIDGILAEMRSGKAVVFVDVREPEEFREAHIPDSLNVTLRDLRPTVVDQLHGADYVVSYCVKDFRGFEMARALQDAGIERSVILNPYGIQGWISQGLPVAGTEGLSDEQARTALDDCLRHRDHCQALTAS